MIGKLKHRCGAQFTGKMEGMMNDLAVGLDHQKEVRGWGVVHCCMDGSHGSPTPTPRPQASPHNP